MGCMENYGRNIEAGWQRCGWRVHHRSCSIEDLTWKKRVAGGGCGWEAKIKSFEKQRSKVYWHKNVATRFLLHKILINAAGWGRVKQNRRKESNYGNENTRKPDKNLTNSRIYEACERKSESKWPRRNGDILNALTSQVCTIKPKSGDQYGSLDSPPHFYSHLVGSAGAHLCWNFDEIVNLRLQTCWLKLLDYYHWFSITTPSTPYENL